MKNQLNDNISNDFPFFVWHNGHSLSFTKKMKMTAPTLQDHLSAEAHPLKGILYCFLGYAFVALMGVFEKPINTTVPVTTILFFQSFICLILLVPETLKNYQQLLHINHLSTYLIRIISGVAGFGALFYLIQFIPLSEAFLYQYSASLWIPFIMLIWLKVGMNKKLWWGILVGFLGIVLMLKPNSSMFGLITVAGISCSILQAISVVALRRLSVTEPAFRILFYYFLVGSIITGIFMFHHPVALTGKDWALLLLVGTSSYLAQKFITASLKYAHASTLAPIAYSSILITGILGWLIWHEIPTAMTMLGMLLVMTGCIITVVLNRTSKLITETDAPVDSMIALPEERN